MKPQEKVAELELKFYKAIQYDVVKSARNRVAKQCAIITVNELINAIPKTVPGIGYGNAMFNNPEYLFYQEVLTELNQP